MERVRNPKVEDKKSRHKTSEKAKVGCKEEEIYREINSRSFGDNFTILIQHYKRQIEISPPKVKIP